MHNIKNSYNNIDEIIKNKILHSNGNHWWCTLPITNDVYKKIYKLRIPLNNIANDLERPIKLSLRETINFVSLSPK